MREILNINRKWSFCKNVTAPPAEIDPRWDYVNLPHTWNNIDGQDGGGDYFRGSCCYAQVFSRYDLPEGQRYFVEIQGANSSADLYLNGKLLAHHDGGYSTWRAEITEQLEADNILAVIVDNSPNDRVYPQMADFTFYGGLYRDVNIIAVAESHFELDNLGGSGLKISPVVKDGAADVKVELAVSNFKAGQLLRYSIFEADGTLLCSYEGEELSHSFAIDKPHLWHGRKDPYLYLCKAELVEDGKVLDCVSSSFGCRSYVIDPERGFILNGEEYPLRGVSRHQDRWGYGNALLREHHEEDMALICEMGANTIRLAHYQHDQYFYDLCDRYGMAIWAEIPYISNHLPNGRENTVSQMKELIAQNYNHPSIVVWGLSNEITMKGAEDPDLLENHRILNDLCHELDPYRPTTMACVSMCPMDASILNIPDTLSYNHYFGWYGGETGMNGPWFDKFHAMHPEIPVGCSEYGCEALNWHTSDPQQGDYTEEYQAYYHEELIKQLFSRKYIWATHVWNMFDFGCDARNEGGENGQNHKGLVTIDRQYKKDSFYAYKAWLSDEPFVHLCSKRYIDRVEDVTKVTVYSNQPQVELFANGESLGVKQAEDHFFRFDVPNVGETRLVAVAGDCRDESLIRKVDVFNEEYRLKEKGAILNWFDVTEIEGRLSINSKMRDILATFGGKVIMLGFALKIAGKLKGGEKKGKSSGGFKLDKGALNGAMDMLGSFTILRAAGLASMANIRFTKEELLKLNKKLNRVKAPKK